MPRLVPCAALALAACTAARADIGTHGGVAVSAPAAVDVPTPLVIDEIAADAVPDWFEVVNTTPQPIELADFVYVDVAGDLGRARPFPDRTLDPGERHVQNVDVAIDGFRLDPDESLWIYRAAGGALVDYAYWDEGDSPYEGSWARLPSVTGEFATRARDTRGEPNR